MWTFDRFPSAAIAKTYGVTIDSAWLDRVRQSVVRLQGCTGSFVSGDGLILTNHHCVEGCLAQHSTREKSLIESGVLADRREDEIRCATQIADVLVGDRGRDGARRRGRAWARRSRRERAASANAHEPRANLREGRAAAMRGRDALRRRSVLALQVQALHGRAARVHARGRHRGVRRRPRQFPVPALGPRHGATARVRRRSPGRHTEPFRDRLRRTEGGPARVRRGAPGLDRPRAHGRAAHDAARFRSPSVAAALFRAARPLHSVRKDEPLGRADRARDGCSASRTASRSAASCSTRCSTTTSCAASATTRPRCGAASRTTRSCAPRSAIRGPESKPRSARKRRSSCGTRTSRTPRASTAGCSATHASSCVRRPSGRNRTRSGCANTATPRCRSSSSRSAPRCRSIRSSKSSRCRSRSSGCASGSAPTIPSSGSCLRPSRPTRSRPRS